MAGESWASLAFRFLIEDDEDDMFCELAIATKIVEKREREREENVVVSKIVISFLFELRLFDAIGWENEGTD